MHTTSTLINRKSLIFFFRSAFLGQGFAAAAAIAITSANKSDDAWKYLNWIKRDFHSKYCNAVELPWLRFTVVRYSALTAFRHLRTKWSLQTYEIRQCLFYLPIALQSKQGTANNENWNKFSRSHNIFFANQSNNEL